MGQTEAESGNIEGNRHVNMSKIWLNCIQKHDNKNVYFWRQQEVNHITIPGVNNKIETRVNISLRSFICWVS